MSLGGSRGQYLFYKDRADEMYKSCVDGTGLPAVIDHLKTYAQEFKTISQDATWDEQLRQWDAAYSKEAQGWTALKTTPSNDFPDLLSMFPEVEKWPQTPTAVGWDGRPPSDFDCTVVVESGVFGGLQADNSASVFTFQNVLFVTGKYFNVMRQRREPDGFITIKGNLESTIDGHANVFVKLLELIVPEGMPVYGWKDGDDSITAKYTYKTNECQVWVGMMVEKGGKEFKIHEIHEEFRMVQGATGGNAAPLVRLTDDGQNIAVDLDVMEKGNHPAANANQYSDSEIRSKCPQFKNAQFYYTLKSASGEEETVVRGDFAPKTDGSPNLLQKETEIYIKNNSEWTDEFGDRTHGTWSIGPIPVQAVRAAELKASLNGDTDLKAIYEQQISAMYVDSAAACRAEKFTKLTSSYFVDNIKTLYQTDSDQCNSFMEATYGVFYPAADANSKYRYLLNSDLCKNDDYKFFCRTENVGGADIRLIDEAKLTKPQILSHRMLQYRLRDAIAECKNPDRD